MGNNTSAINMGCGGSDEEKKPSGPSTFFLIQHDFAEDKAEEWWANTQKIMGDAEALKAMTDAANAAGFHNHAFMPVSQTKAFCIWEAEAGKSLDDMKKYIDSAESSPAHEKYGVTNAVYTIRGDLSGPSPWPDSLGKDKEAVSVTPENKGESALFIV